MTPPRRKRKAASGERHYFSYVALDAEGLRIGLATCRRCGAVVMLAEGEDGPAKHDEWHDKLLRRW